MLIGKDGQEPGGRDGTCQAFSGRDGQYLNGFALIQRTCSIPLVVVEFEKARDGMGGRVLTGMDGRV